MGRERPKLAMVERELTLTLEFEPARLAMHGKADRLEPGRLVDFKTDAEGDGLAERYGRPVRPLRIGGPPGRLPFAEAELAIYHAPGGNYLPVFFTSDDERRLRGELEAFAATLAQPEPAFAPVRSEFCRWCAARETVCRANR